MKKMNLSMLVFTIYWVNFAMSQPTNSVNINEKGIESQRSVVDLNSFDSIMSFVEENPNDPNVEYYLKKADELYFKSEGELPRVLGSDDEFFAQDFCQKENCIVWAHVSKVTQTLYLYINGEKTYEWKVSTGIKGRGTPNFDKHPDGRIYKRYTSRKFPGGDYKGLGNMPYAVFISGGFAIHGTPSGNWSKLGRPASHGCIRLHPDNAQIFNSVVRSYGVENVWITVDSQLDF